MIGDGPEGRRLRRLAGPTVTFTGRIPDPQVAEVLAGARALVVTAVEEFGIAAVEALAAGRPVIAFGEGGVRESVAARRHRRLLRAQRPGGAGRDRARPSTPLAVDSAACRAAAERFSVPRFQSRLAAIVADAVSDERPPRPERAAGARGRAAQRRAPRGPAGGAGTPLAHRLGSPCKPPFRSFGQRAESHRLIDCFTECVTNWHEKR